MSKYLLTSLLIYSYCASAMETESLLNDLDLKYADSEELYRQIFGHVEEQKDILFDADVLVDGEASGSAPTFIGKTCKIQAAALKNCLTDYLNPDEIEFIDKCKDEDGFVMFQKLDNLSLKTRLNRLTMQVEISLPIEKKKVRSLSGRKKCRDKISNVEPANVSAVLNMRVAQLLNHERFSSDNKKNLILTPYINLFGLCLEGEASYEKASNSKGKFHRGYTTLVYDWEEPDVMFKCGDIFSRSLSYQNPPRIWGFNVNKDVEREKSEGFSSPVRITLLKTSTIEVYSNNNLIRTRTNVAPGTYILDDISYNNGANDIKIKIIDESGREEILDKSFFYESSFVPQGNFTFNGSYGYPEVNNSVTGRYDKKNPLLSLTVRYGLLTSVELGIGILKTKAGKTRSCEIRNKNILGNFDLKFACSNYVKRNKHISGKVYYVQYITPSMSLFNKTNFSLSTSIEKSDNFFKPYLLEQSTDFNANPSSKEIQLNSDEITKKEENLKGKNTTVNYRANLSNILSCNMCFNYSRKTSFDKKSSRRYSLDVSRALRIDNAWFSNGNLSANFSRNTESDGTKGKSFSIYCSISLKNHLNLSSGYSRTDGDFTEYLAVSNSSGESRFNYDITAEKSRDKNRAKINTNYTNSIFRGNLNCSRNNRGSSSVNIGAESALYFADGRFAIAKTDYSDGGFVLVTPKKDLSKHKIKFIDRETESGFLGGGAVLHNSRISSSISRIDLREIPDDISLKQDTIVSQGQYKRGLVADIQGIKSITAQGILVDSQGKILEQVTGFVINKDNIDEPPVSFFTNSSGEFSLTELKPGRYKLTVNLQNTEDIELQIDDNETDKDNVLILGTVICRDSDMRTIKERKNDETI